jgi:hypothetical protein
MLVYQRVCALALSQIQAGSSKAMSKLDEVLKADLPGSSRVDGDFLGIYLVDPGGV